jgi:hypothetical protein
MQVQFHQGVPDECVRWLHDNVGRGHNLDPNPHGSGADFYECAWYYERVLEEITSTDPTMDSNFRYTPTITVKDPKMAVLFALRWSS